MTRSNKNKTQLPMFDTLEGRTLYSGTPQVMGYLPDYEYAQSGTQIMANLKATKFEGLTQINFFSVLPDANGMLPGTSVKVGGKTLSNTGTLTSNGDSSDPLSNIDKVVTAAHAAGVKVDIVIGGAGSNSVQLGKDILAGSQVWKNFASSVMSFVKAHKLDGVDIDWEPAWGEATAAQVTDYDSMLAQLRSTAGTALKISAAVDSEEITLSDDKTQEYVLNTQAVKSLNTINVMAYDLGNPADNAPIQQTQNDLAGWATYVGSHGGNKSQLIYGVPFYGKATTIDTTIANQWPLVSNDPNAVNVDEASYNDIVTAAGNSVDYSLADVNQSVDSLSVPGTFNGNAPAETWNFDNRGAVYAKTKIALQQGYGGVMAWAIGQDYGATSTAGFSQSKSLLPAIQQAISDFHTGTSPAPTPAPSVPSISGSVFNDVNQNYTQDAGEKGLAGFTVFIDANHDGVLDNGELSTTSDANGNFSFSNVPVGNCDVVVEAKSGYNATNWPDQLATVVSGKTAYVGFGEVAI